jgi:phosphoglycolate phosphatase
MTRAVIFDLDGTLIDSLPDVLAALNAVLAAGGRRPVTIDEGRTMVGGGAEPLIERAFAMTGDALAPPEVRSSVEAFTANYRMHPARETTIFDGVIPVLEGLTARGMKLGICTNKPHNTALQVLGALSLDRHFASCIGKAALPFNKPDRRHYDEVARALGVAPERSIYVGDSETDVATAQNAGVPVVLVTFGYSLVPASEMGADRLIEHFSELPAALDDLFSNGAMPS